jgi:Na+/proline symporter
VNLQLLAAGNTAALVTFAVYTLAVFGLAALSNQLLKSRSFLSEYFLGSRGLGVWAFALTFAATSASGGSFTGFPSKIYTHGWVLGLWIGSYIVVPICAMGLLGKRLNNVARISGSITVPDVLRDRFNSPAFGAISVTLIVFFMSFNLIAQFKAGSLILQTLLDGVDMFHSFAATMRGPMSAIGFLEGVEPEYFLCLFAFGVAVIVYTTYGGFHAVVWTDVMQGVVMVVGVLLMLPLAIYMAGGLGHVTNEMAHMEPPVPGTATVVSTAAEPAAINSGTWVQIGDDDAKRLFKIPESQDFAGSSQTIPDVEVLEIITANDIDRVLKSPDVQVRIDLSVEDLNMTPYEYGAEEGRKGVYVTGPGPHRSNSDGFLPLSLAISFFFMWAISGAGQPSSMVRLMAFKDAKTLRRAIFAVAIYYSAIYFPLVIIFCCARVLMPGMDLESDRIMPAMAVYLTQKAGVAWLAGLLVAAPFAAVMSTVDSFLLMISSALVRDIYQRKVNPRATEKQMKYLAYLCTLIVGTAAMVCAINPPQFLQDIIVYTGSGLAACFLGPMVFALYWPRANATGCIAGMLGGFAAHLSMYVGGAIKNESFFHPYRLFDFDPIIVGLFASFASVLIVTVLTPPPDQKLVAKYFHKRTTA